MKKRILTIARELLALPTAPFREDAIRDYVRRFAVRRGFRVTEDDMGNLLVRAGPPSRRPVLAFAAHMDHPGFIVEQDSRRGRATARFYGGVETEYFPGAQVRVFTAGGPVAARVLTCRATPRRHVFRVALQVDGPVRRGDLGMWALPAVRIRNGRIRARACDDLVGCVSILALLDAVGRRGSAQPVLGVFTVAEEVGLNGAAYLCRGGRLPRTLPLVAIETSRELPVARMGDGVVIRVGDRLSVFTPAMTAFLVQTARHLALRDRRFRFQRKLMDGGVCESTLYQAFGHINGAVCVPLGNYHNRDFRRTRIAAEYVSISDLENMVKLFLAMVDHAGQIPRFLRPRLPRMREERGDLGERFFAMARHPHDVLPANRATA